ncbi:uncharacterized protein LOC144641721 [Oculina patagonica]
MESLKEFLLSKYFSSFGYIVAVFYIPALITFLGFTAQLRTSERRRFRCQVPNSQDECLAKYDEQFNSPFPLYGFVLLSFVPLVVVCIAYSWCFVKSRVDEIEPAMKSDLENPRPRPRVTTRRVFFSYFLQLSVRLTLGIVFILFQSIVFYPSGFPIKFICASQTANSTDFNVTIVNYDVTNDGSGITNICDNSVASDNAICAKGIWIVNILFAVLVFAEMCYLFVQAIQSKQFTFDSEFCHKYFFNKRRTPVTLRESTLRMRKRILEDTEILEPLTAPSIETKDTRALDDIFVDFVIYTGRAEHALNESLERHEIYDIYLKPQRGSVAIKNIEGLFLPNEDTKHPRKILIVGRPGIGKSLLCRKLSRDWSKGDMFRDSNKNFEHLFSFQFRWFNSAGTTAENISLKHLLSRVYPEGSIDNELFQYLLDNPEKVLLVFDGLDEFKHHENCLEDEQAHAGNSATEEMPFSALYVKLLKGKQLSGATVLTTCRPNVVQSVAGLTFDRMVEIMGFTPEKVEEYVHKFCTHQDPETMNRIWVHISSNLELLSLCYIPVNSFIVCSLLEKLITIQDHKSDSALPTTSTEIYDGALRLFIFKHHPEFKGKILTRDYLMGNAGFPDTVEQTLSQVGSLAKTGIDERRLMFESTEVQGMENCGLFNRMPDIEVSPYTFRSYFCFIHLTLQELLAAREIAKMDPSDIIDFISSNASDPKWHLVIQFVAGLLHGQDSEAIKIFASLLRDSLTVNAEPKQALLMIKCLYEYNDETAVQNAAFELNANSEFNKKLDLIDCQITPVDCIAIAYLVGHLNCTALNLELNHVTDQGVPHLCDALRGVHCKLNDLRLGSNSITDKGVSHLCEALKHVNCKLTKLDLSDNYIKGRCLSHLGGALKHANCKLSSLNLSFNYITDEGIPHLSDALKHVNCNLMILDLRGNDVTDQCLTHLCSALKHHNCQLIKLHLGKNVIADEGVLHLCDAIKDVSCKITELSLADTNITDEGVSLLFDALKDVNCKLTALDLSVTKTTDQGVSHLCDSLKHVNCKLTKLSLSMNQITDQGILHLCDVLKDVNCKLAVLYLEGSNITEQGKMQLLQQLKECRCELRI